MTITQSEIKQIQSLNRKKYRKIHRQYIIEGKRLIEEALKAKQPLFSIYTTESFQQNNAELFHKLTTEYSAITIVREKEMNALSSTVRPSGILAVCSVSQQNNTIPKSDNVLYLDGISDPGNMGTLLRTAVWFGVYHIVLSPKCVEIYNPKVVRSAMGAHFYLQQISDISLSNFSRNHLIIGANQKGTAWNNVKITSPWVLVLGSEAHGISQQNLEWIHESVAVSGGGKGESLNAAVAGGILLERLAEKKQQV